MNGLFPLGDINPFRYFFGIAVIVGLVFAFISSTNNEPFSPRLVQWQLQSLLPMALMVGTHIGLSFLSSFNRLSVWQKVFMSGAVGASLFSPLALLIDIFYANEGWPQSFAEELAGEWLGVFFPAILVWMLINTPWILDMQFVKRTSADSQLKESKEVKPVCSYPFMSHLRQDMGDDLLCISSQLHYLEVVTANGKQLILYALKDAILEVQHDKGMQVHRSHWVAFEAIASFKRTGREGIITLVNGLKLPVSRSYIKTLSTQLETMQLVTQ